MPIPSGHLGGAPSLLITARGQAAAERLMTDECEITRKAADPSAYDPDTDTYAHPQPFVVYAGKCRIKPADTTDRDAVAGETVITTRAVAVSLPVSAIGVRVGDVVDITHSADPDLAGIKLRVRGIARGSQITARRLACEEIAR